MPPRKPYCSTSVVFAPARAADNAAIRPDGPPPATTTSDSLCTFISIEVSPLLVDERVRMSGALVVVRLRRLVERRLGVGVLHDDFLDRLGDLLRQLREVLRRLFHPPVLLRVVGPLLHVLGRRIVLEVLVVIARQL